MDGVTWRTHRGQKILFVDYRNKRGTELVATLEEAGRVVQASPPGVRQLADFTGVPVGPEFMNRAKSINVEIFAPRQMRLALLGIDGIKAVLVRGFNAVASKGIPAVPCRTELEAYEYLLR